MKIMGLIYQCDCCDRTSRFDDTDIYEKDRTLKCPFCGGVMRRSIVVACDCGTTVNVTDDESISDGCPKCGQWHNVAKLRQKFPSQFKET